MNLREFAKVNLNRIKDSVGELLNIIMANMNPKLTDQFHLNFGVRRVLYRKRKFWYNERLIELPFLFRQILNPPSEVLDIGCAESLAPIQLAMLGYSVTGIDIRDYGYRHQNFKFIKSDFNTYDFGKKKFDIILNISAIEHFGLTSYGNEVINKNADREAVNKILSLLRNDGQFIFTAPFAAKARVLCDFERIYDYNAIVELFRGFDIRLMEFYKITKLRSIIEINRKDTEDLEYADRNGIYDIVCINAIVGARSKSN